MTPSAGWITDRVLIPDLLRAAPQARPVLDRYGLRGCGGPLGPVESLGFFAKAHDVPTDRLLEEIRASIEQPAAPVAESSSDQLADALYRPFFRAGIAVVLTLGAAWGAYLLARIAWLGSFAAAGLHDVNAHGHAQIFGWVGLFVMGFAYQAFPRFKHTTLAHPRLALATFWLMIVGIMGRSVAEPLAGTVAGMGTVAVAASVLEVIAIGLFVAIIVRTLATAGKRLEFYDFYILSALAWFVVQAVYETLYLAATLQAADADQLINLVATWQGALRDIQIHGFALLMILGVSQRLFHHFYGLPAPNRRISTAALIALNAAILSEATGLVLMRTSGHAWAALWYTAVLLLAGTLAVLVGSWHLFSPPEESDRSLKFLRAAYVWLFVSLGMLLLLPVYQIGVLPRLAPESTAAHIGFSHAYYGAVRHAITVGFVSLMIVGVAAKVVPTLNGLNVRALSALWGPFVLINLGCTLRVTTQTLTDFTPSAYPVAGISGLLEVLGLALWGIHLWRIMAGKLAAAAEPTRDDAPAASEPIHVGHRVGAVLERYPELLPVFLAFGFKPLANPLLRRMLARNVTIAAACRLQGQEPQALLDALNAARGGPMHPRLSLPVLTGNLPAQ
jgi:hypothetical protein